MGVKTPITNPAHPVHRCQLTPTPRPSSPRNLSARSASTPATAHPSSGISRKSWRAKTPPQEAGTGWRQSRCSSASASTARIPQRRGHAPLRPLPPRLLLRLRGPARRPPRSREDAHPAHRRAARAASRAAGAAGRMGQAHRRADRAARSAKTRHGS